MQKKQNNIYEVLTVFKMELHEATLTQCSRWSLVLIKETQLWTLIHLGRADYTAMNLDQEVSGLCAF